MKKILPIGIVFGVLMTPFITGAHVKWFTEVVPEKESIEQILSPLFMSLALTAAVVLAILTLLIPRTTKWKQIEKWDQKLSSLRKYSKYILKYGTAIALTIQVTNGTLFAPELPISHPIELLLAWVGLEE